MGVLEKLLTTGGNPSVGEWQQSCLLAGITGGGDYAGNHSCTKDRACACGGWVRGHGSGSG